MMLGWESVRATLIFFWMTEGESVRMIRDFSSAWDLDIFDVGSLRDMTRLAGACILLDGAILATVMVRGELSQIWASGIGKIGPYRWLKLLAVYLENSKCCL